MQVYLIHIVSRFECIISDQEYLKRIKKCDVEIGLPANNYKQNKAIRVALKSSFCLIHGPPGNFLPFTFIDDKYLI